MNIAEKTLQLKQDFDEVYEAGKKAEYDAFWDMYQQNGTRTNVQGMFCGFGWTADTIKPKYDININIDATFIFYRSGFVGSLKEHFEKLGRKIDFSKAVGLTSAFQFAEKITELPVLDLSSVDTALRSAQLMYGMTNLQRIEMIKVSEVTAFNPNAFTNDKSLTDVIFTGILATNGLNLQWSPLTHDSLMSIINALQDKTGDTSGTAWVVTIGPTNKAKLTDDELAIAYEKGWEVQ